MQTKKTMTLSRSLVLAGVAVSVAASGFAGLAYAQGRDKSGWDGPQRGGAMFERMDADKDGAVSEDEFLGGDGSRFFARFDTDKDGTVTKEEVTEAISKARQRRLERRVQRMTAPFDANGDGSVSKEEFDAFRKKRFALMDVNNDGKVEREEARAVMAAMMGGGYGGYSGYGWGHRGWSGQSGWRGHHGWGHHGMQRGGFGGRWYHDRGMPPAPADADDMDDMMDEMMDGGSDTAN